MARKVKINSSFKERFARIEKSKEVETKERRLYFLIVCEGTKTEPNYFKELKKDLPKESVVISDMHVKGTGRNTESLVDFTIKYRDSFSQKFDRVWAVFDRDSFSEKQFNTSIAKASYQNINSAWSNEAFELWFILHFQFVNHAMPREDFKAFITREINRKSKSKGYVYEKNQLGTYKILQSLGNQDQAIKWAKQLHNTFEGSKFASRNPCTLVYMLIEELLYPEKVLKKLEEEEKEEEQVVVDTVPS